MSHENVSPHDSQIPENESPADPREIQFKGIVASWSNSVQESAVAALSSLMVGSNVSARIRAHDEHGEFERRVLIEELRKVHMKNRQIRFVFRHYGLKVPKDGLKNKKSS